MKDRIYICHTFYHVYISVLKELNLPVSERGKASIILSTMSNDFGSIDKRIMSTNLFEAVYWYDEKEDVECPEVMKYHTNQGNIVLNMLQRMKYTKLLGKAQEPYIPVNLKEYGEVNVYCDSDPIGHYLNYKHIKYRAIEDGLDTIMYCDDARYNNRGHFRLKCFMAKHNLIFIENGYSKYCTAMEVNNAHDLPVIIDKYVEIPRRELADNVADSDRHYLMEIFMEDSETLIKQVTEVDQNKRKVLILSDPVCDLDTRAQIMRDIITEYGDNATVFIKPHPRDVLDYTKGGFEDCIVIRGRFPMEMMNYFPELHMDVALSIFTVVDNIEFADKKIKLGCDFMDRYEAPEIHRQNEQI